MRQSMCVIVHGITKVGDTTPGAGAHKVDRYPLSCEIVEEDDLSAGPSTNLYFLYKSFFYVLHKKSRNNYVFLDMIHIFCLERFSLK